MESIFQLNQIVWAKINGYPWWPAYVKAEVKANQYEVVFFGDFSRAILHLSKIQQFDEIDPKANCKNKVLNAALRSAERIMSGESSIMDEWNKIDKSALAPAQPANKSPQKKPTKKIFMPDDEPSESLSNTSRAKCQESDTKVESDEPVDFKCGNSAHNNVTSSTYNHFIDKQEQGDEPALVEERLEELYSSLKSDDYKSEGGVRAIHEITARALALEPKCVFSSNIGVLMSTCMSVSRSKLPQRPYRLTLELLSDSLSKICDYLIKDGFLMEFKVSAEYIDMSKRNSIITEFFPDLASPGLFGVEMSPVSKQHSKVETQCETVVEREEARAEALVDVEPRVQFRVKRKLAKVIYSEESKERSRKKVCEQMAIQIEHLIRAKSRTMSDYKEEVMLVVRELEKNGERTSDIVCGFTSGKKLDAMIKNLNKLTSC